MQNTSKIPKMSANTKWSLQSKWQSIIQMAMTDQSQALSKVNKVSCLIGDDSDIIGKVISYNCLLQIYLCHKIVSSKHEYYMPRPESISVFTIAYVTILKSAQWENQVSSLVPPSYSMIEIYTNYPCASVLIEQSAFFSIHFHIKRTHIL